MSNTGPVVAPTPTPPDQNINPPTPDQVNAFVAFIQNLVSSGTLRQTFDPRTYQFWTTLSGLAGIILAWVNPGNALSTTIQATITAVSGLVLAVVAAQAKKPTVASLIRDFKKIASLPEAHKEILRKAFTPLVLNPSPAGQVGSEGYYVPGTPNGSVLSPGAVVVVPGYKGATGATGDVSTGLTNEGNVVSPITVVVQQGAYPNPNAEPYSPLSPTALLPNQSGDNSAEGTGGPAISDTQGGLGVGGSVESPGGYVPPVPNQPNPDEENPNIFVAKAQRPTHKARKRVSEKEHDGEEN